ncbi:hypothetical protein BLSTO_01694 [Blastocystis sp. subtype 1]
MELERDDHPQPRSSCSTRLSLSPDIIPETQKRDNEIFSPKKVVEDRYRQSRDSCCESIEEGVTDESYPCARFRWLLNASSVQKGGKRQSRKSQTAVDSLFSTTVPYSEETLLEIGLDMFDVYSEVRQVLKEYPTISDSTSGYFLPKKLPTAPKYTIVLDLDGTLIYCTREERERYDATFTIPSVDEYTGEQVDLTLYLSFRPYVFEFLKEMSKLYEIIIFTASTPCYARKIVDFFNKDGIVIQHLLTREQTTYLSNGFHFKDLQRLNRDMVSPSLCCYA